jgi:hypothetical protein
MSKCPVAGDSDTAIIDVGGVVNCRGLPDVSRPRLLTDSMLIGTPRSQSTPSPLVGSAGPVAGNLWPAGDAGDPDAQSTLIA